MENTFNLKSFLAEGKLLKEQQNFNKWSHNDNYGMEIVFKPFPSNPEGLLHDNEGEEDFTKANFWETDITKPDHGTKVEQGYIEDILYASKNDDGTWEFTWDAGNISGFIEGEDFEFIPEGEL
jgi:hypothetical protein